MSDANVTPDHNENQNNFPNNDDAKNAKKHNNSMIDFIVQIITNQITLDDAKDELDTENFDQLVVLLYVSSLSFIMFLDR